MKVSQQAILLYIATNGLLDEVPLDQVREFAWTSPSVWSWSTGS